jgi:predicted Zn finger-like uncharacterized protein
VYTRCPQCQTVFRLTAAQFKLRDGMVRCGRCQHAFQADQHLVERPAKNAAKPAGAARKRSPRKTGKGETRAAPDTTTTPASDAAHAESGAAAPHDPAVAEPLSTPGRDAPDPAGMPLSALELPAGTRTRTLYWSLASVPLVVALLAQVVVFYGAELVRAAPTLKPTITLACRALPCRSGMFTDMRLLDLIETRVTPHPRYDKALRIQATIVNRAGHVQPYPRLEVTLIDSQGQVVARRAYKPREYLRKTAAIRAGLTPQLAENIQLEITSPGAQASGYEILLLPASE